MAAIAPDTEKSKLWWSHLRGVLDGNGVAHLRELAGMVANGFDVNQRNTEGMTALMFVCSRCTFNFRESIFARQHESNEESLVALLLRAGSLLEVTDSNGNTPLLLAAGRINYRLCIMLIDAGANFTHLNRQSRSAQSLYRLSERQYLVKRASSPSILCHYCRCGMLEEAVAQVKTTTNGSQRIEALHEAIYFRHTHIAWALIDQKIDIDADCEEFTLGVAKRPWLHAQWANMGEMVTRLIELDPKADIVQHPLLHAVKNHNIVVVDTLASAAIINAHAHSFRNLMASALIEATGCNSEPIVSMLLNRGADINGSLPGTKGWTALLAAAHIDCLVMVDLLLRRGADPNLCFSEVLDPQRSGVDRLLQENLIGTSPIQAAARAGNCEMIRRLVSHGAVADGESGQRALVSALKRHDETTATVLLGFGVCPNFRVTGSEDCLWDDRWDSPLDIAVVQEMEGVISAMIRAYGEAWWTSQHRSVALCKAMSISGSNNLFTIIMSAQTAEGAPSQADMAIGLHPVLCRAVQYSQSDFVRELLRRGASPNVPNDIIHLRLGNEKISGVSAMHFTSRASARDTENRVQILRALIESGGSVDILSQCGAWTPLLVACRFCHYEIVAVLLEHGAAVNLCTTVGSPLSTACSEYSFASEKLKIIVALLEAGARVTDIVGAGSFTALHQAVQDPHRLDERDDTHIYVASLLLQKGANVDARQADGCTPLGVATGHPFISLILDSGAVADRENVELALYNMAWSDDIVGVRRLIDAGADVNCRISKHQGRTPLMAAAAVHALDVVEYLLQRGADVHATSTLGATALIFACDLRLGAARNVYHHDTTRLYHDWKEIKRVCTAVIDELVHNGSTLDSFTELIRWSHLSKNVTTRMFVDLGANYGIATGEPVMLAIEGPEKWVPLYYAEKVWTRFTAFNKNIKIGDRLCRLARERNREALSTLLDLGVPVDSTSSEGSTALMVAAYEGATDIVEELLARGADASVTTKGGVSALSLAWGHGKIVEMLTAKVTEGNIDPSRTTAVELSKRGSELLNAVVDGDIEAVEAMLQAGQIADDALYKAVQLNHRSIANKLLEAGADPNLGPSDDLTPLMLSAARGWTELVSNMLAHDARVNEIRQDRSALALAAENGHLLVVQTLLTARANMNELDGIALHCAIKKGHLDVVDALLLHGADPSIVKDQLTPLMLAVRCGHSDVVRIICAQPRAQRDQIDKFGNSALHMAAETGNEHVVSSLCSEGCAVNLQNSQGKTPLLIAVENRRTPASQALLKAGANVNLAGGKQMTSPMYVAAEIGYVDGVRLLADYAADVNQVNIEGWTPLMTAVDEGHDRVVSMLIQLHAIMNAPQPKDPSPLLLAMRRGHVKIFRQLANAGADVNAVLEGVPLLHQAVMSQNMSVTRILMEYGANLEQRMSASGILQRGKTAIELAIEMKHEALIGLFRLFSQPCAGIRQVRQQMRQPLVDQGESGGAFTSQHLLAACVAGRRDVVHALLSVLGARDKQSPVLLEAISRGCDAYTVALLLDHGWDVTLVNSDGLSALHLAVSSGNASMVRLLLEYGADPATRTAPTSLLKRSKTTAELTADVEILQILRSFPPTAVLARLQAELERAHTQPQTLQSREPQLVSTERISQCLLTVLPFQKDLARGLELLRTLDPSLFTFDLRLGKHTQKAGYYGSNGAVYAITPPASLELADSPMLPLSIKIMFNLHLDARQTRDVLNKCEAEWGLLSDTQRLPWHPNITRVYHRGRCQRSKLADKLSDLDVDPDYIMDSCAYILQPRLTVNLAQFRSGRLKDFMEGKRSSIFSAPEFFFYGLQLCLAVQHLHRHQIVHQDLTPGNVVLGGARISDSEDSLYSDLVVIDFGCSIDLRISAEKAGSFKMAFVTDSRLGTAAYLPPEITSARFGRGCFIDYDKSDVFSAGRCLYALVCTRELLEAANDSTTNYVDAHFVPLDGSRDEPYPPEVEAVLRAMLRASMAERCSADDAVQMMLDGFLRYPLPT